MGVKFKDNSFWAVDAINKVANKWLHESAGEIQSQTQKNSRRRTSKTAQSFSYVISDTEQKATIGSPEMNAVWEEFGTGDYAIKGDGRKGGWYVPIGYGPNQIDPDTVKHYGFRIYYGKNGVKYIFTKGKRPSRALTKAFESCMPSVEKRLEELIKGGLK